MLCIFFFKECLGALWILGLSKIFMYFVFAEVGKASVTSLRCGGRQKGVELGVRS